MGAAFARWTFAWLFVACLAGLTASVAGAAPRGMVSGTVVSGKKPLAGMSVTLYATTSAGRAPVVLGRAVSRKDGSFAIDYRRAKRARTVTYVIARRGGTVRLASALGTGRLPRRTVVNERTTAATAFALAQFVGRGGIAGKAPGLQNAAAMVRNLVDVRTGGVGRVLRTSPNGRRTSTMRTFNSLANMAVRCARSTHGCRVLFRLARPPGGAAPKSALVALADIARNPSHNAGRLFALSRPATYRPALKRSHRPDAWTLALRFDGDGKTMNGPGNMAIDAQGNVWATDNYTYSRDPLARVCGGKLLVKFTPTGEYAQGSPFTGGGLDGAGFGITLDSHSNVWVGNFGFSSSKCSNKPAHNSVSKFSPQGDPISPSGGFTQGGVSWPQAVVADRQDNIWVANCGNNTVTRYAGGDPDANLSIPLAIEKPFDIAFNGRGQAFVTGSASSSVQMLNPDGTSALPAPITAGGIDRPMGIAPDIEGNMWVANSGFANVPCPKGGPPPRGHTGSIARISSDGTSATEFTGGGLTNPWGVAVDGQDKVWIANFGGKRLSVFCGSRPANCPPGKRTGQAISPSTGYGFDGLVRNTGLQVDPSGNVWVANNWKSYPVPSRNPGGYQLVAFIGLAAPIKTPLIGPPRPF